MKTIVELTLSQRAGLLKLAAEPGEKAFSRLIHEAIDRYLEAEMRTRVKNAIGVLGTLDDSAAERMMETVRAIRES